MPCISVGDAEATPLPLFVLVAQWYPLPLFWFKVPLKATNPKKGYPYHDMGTGLPSCTQLGNAWLEYPARSEPNFFQRLGGSQSLAEQNLQACACHIPDNVRYRIYKLQDETSYNKSRMSPVQYIRHPKPETLLLLLTVYPKPCCFTKP